MLTIAALLAVAPAPVLRIGFDGCETISAAGASALQQIAKVMRDPRFATQRFILQGHVASTGNRAEELALSRKLADGALERLVANGIEPIRLESRGYGADHPAVADLPEDGENCRVEIVRA